MTDITTDITVGAIKQIALAVKDLGVSVKFYEKTLGLPLLFKAEPGMAFFDIAGIRLMGERRQHDRYTQTCNG